MHAGSIPVEGTKNKKMKPKLLFTERSLPLILEALGMSMDKEGFALAYYAIELFKKFKHFFIS